MIEVTGRFIEITDRSVGLIRSIAENGFPGEFLEHKL